MADRKRIVIFGWGGSTHVSKWVTGLQSRGFEMKLIGMTGESIPDVESVLYPRAGKLSYMRYMGSAIAEAKRFKPDLVHAHYATGFGLWAWCSGIRPSIVSVWGADVIDVPNNVLMRPVVRQSIKRATWITATSNMLADVTERLVPGTLSRLSVIPFGVRIPENMPVPSSSPSVRICFLKALELKYGPSILIQAMHKAAQSCPNLSLSIAGKGSQEILLRELAITLNIESQVEFVGQIPHEDVYRFISDHDLMVMPSTMESESFGVAALEAAACGRPTIASRVGGVPEVINHGVTGLLVSPGDVDALAEAIEHLASDEEKRQRMGKAAYEYAGRKYDWEKSLDMMAELYERLIHEAKHSAV